MSAQDGWLLAAAAVLLVVAAGVTAASTALARVSRPVVEELVQTGRRGAPALAAVVAEPTGYLSLLQLLQVAAELGAAVLVTVVCTRLLGSAWAGGLLAAGATTIACYVLVGVAAGTLGRQHAARVGLAAARGVLLAARVLGPLPRLLIALGNALTPGRGLRDGPFASEAELRDLVDLAEERRVIEAGERRMVHSVLELGDTLVREVMVPRPDIVFIERDKTVRQGLSLALRSGFSRIPVVGESEDDVVGVVYLKDLARRLVDGSPEPGRVREVMRPAAYVPDSKPVDELLAEMQAARTHVAVVIDEYGGTAGLVTIEDILEEIVGEISDEYDSAVPQVQRVDERTLRVSVRLPVAELGELCSVPLERDDVETVGGLLAAELGRVPIPGATVRLDGLTLVAERGQGRRHRIGTVLVRRERPAGSPAGPGGSGPAERSANGMAGEPPRADG